MKAMIVTIVLAVLVAVELEGPARSAPRASGALVAAASPPAPDPGERELTRPQDLLLLEAPDRAVWQKPELIMDELSIADGSVVADIGAGAGWFTIRLAQRVGPNGIVYAQDVQREMVLAIRRRVTRQGLTTVRVVEGSDTSSGLPSGALDAVLVVDVYAEVDQPIPFLRDLARSLRPQGRIGIVNYKPDIGGPGPPDGRVARDVVERDARAAGLRVISTMDLRYEYLVVLGQEAVRPAAGTATASAMRPRRGQP